jgi:hypothetical protein
MLASQLHLPFITLLCLPWVIELAGQRDCYGNGASGLFFRGRTKIHHFKNISGLKNCPTLKAAKFLESGLSLY